MTTVADVDLSTWNRYATSPKYRGSNPFGLANFPDATTTGVPTGTTLTPSSGMLTTTTNGQVIDALDITGGITVIHDNVTITNTKVFVSGFFRGILHTSGTNLVVTDCEISNASADGINSTSGASATFTRCHVHDCDDNMKIGSNVSLFDSYLHDYRVTANSHNDGLQIPSGSNIIVSGNRIDGQFQDQTSAIIIKSDFGEIDNVQILNNRLSGGSYTLYIRGGNGGGTPTNVTVTGNTFELNSAAFGAFSYDTPTASHIWNTNVWSDGSSYPSPF